MDLKKSQLIGFLKEWRDICSTLGITDAVNNLEAGIKRAEESDIVFPRDTTPETIKIVNNMIKQDIIIKYGIEGLESDFENFAKNMPSENVKTSPGKSKDK